MKKVTIKFRPTGVDKSSAPLEFTAELPSTTQEAIKVWGEATAHNAMIGTSATVQIQAFARRIIKDEGAKKGLAILSETRTEDMLSDGLRKRMTPTEKFLQGFNALPKEEQAKVIAAQATAV